MWWIEWGLGGFGKSRERWKAPSNPYTGYWYSESSRTVPSNFTNINHFNFLTEKNINKHLKSGYYFLVKRALNSIKTCVPESIWQKWEPEFQFFAWCFDKSCAKTFYLFGLSLGWVTLKVDFKISLYSEFCHSYVLEHKFIHCSDFILL